LIVVWSSVVNDMSLILVRYAGEIGTKGRNRKYFVRRLRRNLRAALKAQNAAGKVWSEGQRIYVQVDDEDDDTTLDALQRVFGVASLSPVHRVAANLETIRATALELAKQIELQPPATFRVQTRRADKSFPHISPEVNRLVGGAIQDATYAEVDLSDEADVTIGIEIRVEGAMVYGQTIPGPGGMPIGTQGRVFVLMSGGIDSPVAAWQMMRRGCGIIPIHFCQSETERDKALENCRALGQWSYGWQIKPLILDHEQVLGPIAQRLRELGEERWTCLFCKRAMIDQAAQLADQYHVQALVMGDSLGQVASQTLNNMVAISEGSQILILRPLIALDKNEIVHLAREIGTFEISTQDTVPCPFLPYHPLTRARLDQLHEIISLLE
jgi:thiamine biosynthesis protein ThiI